MSPLTGFSRALRAADASSSSSESLDESESLVDSDGLNVTGGLSLGKSGSNSRRTYLHLLL